MHDSLNKEPNQQKERLVPCPVCNGTGKDKREEPCKVCKGSGRIRVL